MKRKQDKFGKPSEWLDAVRTIERTYRVVIQSPSHLISFCQSLEMSRARLEEKTRAAARVLDMAPADFDAQVEARREPQIQELGDV